MSSKRLNFILIGVLGLLFVALLGGAYGTNVLLSSQASKLTALKAKSQAQDQQQESLNKAKKNIEKYAELEKTAKAIVPEDKNQAEAVREIVNIADANGVTLVGLTFPASSLGSTALPSGAAAASAAAAKPVISSSKTKLSQLTPVKNIPGVYELTITVQNDANHPVQYSKFINFLSGLEHNRRTAQVSTISIAPTTANSNYLTFNLSLTEYIKP